MRFSVTAHSSFLSLTLCVGLWGWAGTVEAYIPPAHFIVKSVVAQRAGFKGMRIRSTVVGFDGQKSSGLHFKVVTLFDARTRAIRSHALDDGGRELYAMERQLTSNEQGIFLPDAILFESNLDHLTRGLRHAGIPISSEGEVAEITWLGRINGMIAWVIGKKDPSQPQLWIEKDRFLPIRLIDKVEGNLADLRFENFRFFKEFPYPRSTTLVRLSGNKEETVLRDELNELNINPDLSEMRSPLQSGLTDAGNSSESPLRDLIKAYYLMVR